MKLKTLIIRFSSVGDIALSSPLVRVLRHRFPDMQMDYLVKDAYADLVRYNPFITRVIPFPSGGTVADLFRLRREILEERYDVILDIHDSLRSRLLCLGAHGVRRINKRKLARFLLVYLKKDVYALLGGAPGVAERYFETAADLGVADDGMGLDIFLPEAAHDHGRMLLAETGISPANPTIGICPSARHFTKIWPGERFAETAVDFARPRQGQILIFGAPDEAARCNEIAAMVRQQAPGIQTAVMAGKCSLLETAALMDKCSVIVTNDTGLMHLAAARKRPVVAIFGSTTRQLGFSPTGTLSRVVENSSLPCRPCTHVGRSRCPLGHFRCMLDISAEMVEEAVNELVGNEDKG